MNLKDALAKVIDLADQNVLDENEDDELQEERDDQLEAIEIVTELLEVLRSKA